MIPSPPALLSLALILGCTPDDRKGRGVSTDPTPAADEPDVHPGVTAVDAAVSANFQDWHFGHLKRGRSCAVADLDLDGRQDIVMGNPSDESLVLRNVSAGPGQLLFEPSVVLLEAEEGSGLAWVVQPADYDDDGDYDLFFGMGGIEGLERNHLFRNEVVPTGELAFTDVTAESGLLGPRNRKGAYVAAPNAGAVWGDVDLDGDVDLYVSEDVWPLRRYDSLEPDDWRGYDLLMLNAGDGTFSNVAYEAGLISQEPTRHSVLVDIDGDLDLDLYENNMTKLNRLWRNLFAETGELRFEDITALAALDGGDLAYPLETFVASTADFNNDGWQDILAFVRGIATEGPYLLGHTLLLNVEGRGFVDATERSRLNEPFESGLRSHAFNGVMGCSPSDVNSDGLVDVFIANGGPEAGTANQLFVARELVEVEYPGVGTVTVPVFDNWSDLVDFPAEEDPRALALGVEYPPYPYRGHGTCVADFDRDGIVEIAVSQGGSFLWGGTSSQEPDRLFQLHLPEKNHWVAVHPVGDGETVSRDAIGTRVAAFALDADGNERAVRSTLRMGNAFSANNGFEVFLGLGQAERLDRIEVLFPDGELVVLDDPAMDQVLTVER